MADQSLFKAVMICDRPPQVSNPGPHIDDTMKKMLDRPAFISTIHISSEVGSRIIREEKPTQQPKPKPTGVVQEHKKWLQQLAADKQKEKDEEEDKKKKKEELKLKLAAKVQQQHQEIRAIKESDLSEDEKERRLVGVITQDKTHTAREEEDFAATQRQPTPRKWVRRARTKPSWAMTVAESDECMEDEADSLLAFTANLDCDAYLDNLEIKESARYMRDRVRDEIQDREREEKRKEADERKREARTRGLVGEDDEEYEWVEVDDRGMTAEEALLANRRELFGKYDKTARSKAHKSSTQDGITSADVKRANPEMATIHSDASLRHVVEQVKGSTQGFAIQAPKTVVIHPVDGTDITEEYNNKEKTVNAHSKTTRASNLPYLYRNPAI